MPYVNTWESEGLYRKFTGEISGDEILESNYELQADPNFLTIKYIINDFTEVTSHSIETTHTKAYATSDNIISQAKGKLKIALIATQASLISLANDYRDQMRGKLFECEIFQSIEDARKWVSNK
jgi:hypothetical protein